MIQPSTFALVDRYVGARTEADFAALKPGAVAVVESARRLRREMSYGYVHALWWVWLEDGRSAASVPPGAGQAVRRIVLKARAKQDLFDQSMAQQLRKPVDAALLAAGKAQTDRVFYDVLFACDGSRLKRHRRGDCRRLIDQSVPPAEGLRLPLQCFPDGVAYAVVENDKVVSVAFAHRAGVMEDKVADVGVETAPEYRQRGYAQTAVSALVEHFTRQGGEARYGCSPDNEASKATALSVGFIPYGVSLILAAPITMGPQPLCGPPGTLS